MRSVEKIFVLGCIDVSLTLKAHQDNKYTHTHTNRITASMYADCKQIIWLLLQKCGSVFCSDTKW